MAQYDVSEIAIGSDSYVLKDAEAREVKADQSDIAIIIDGNKTTHTGGAAVGQYVIVRNSTISGIADGLYKAVQAIPANTAITSAYLAAVSGGLGSEVAAVNNKIKNILHVTSITVTPGLKSISGIESGDIVIFTRNCGGVIAVSANLSLVAQIIAVSGVTDLSYTASNKILNFTLTANYTCDMIILSENKNITIQ